MNAIRILKIALAMALAFLGVVQAQAAILSHVWGGLLMVLVGATMAALQVGGMMMDAQPKPPIT